MASCFATVTQLHHNFPLSWPPSTSVLSTCDWRGRSQEEYWIALLNASTCLMQICFQTMLEDNSSKQLVKQHIRYGDKNPRAKPPTLPQTLITQSERKKIRNASKFMNWMQRNLVLCFFLLEDARVCFYKVPSRWHLYLLHRADWLLQSRKFVFYSVFTAKYFLLKNILDFKENIILHRQAQIWHVVICFFKIFSVLVFKTIDRSLSTEWNLFNK